MEFRVDELAAHAGVSVDTVRYYQARGLLHPPTRVGRTARYDDDHLARLERIASLQERGFSLATIGRFLRGELDAADEALVAAVDGDGGEGIAASSSTERFLTLAEVAERSGIPLALLQSVEREGLLVPRTHDGSPCYTEADVEVARTGLTLLEHGLPLPEVLALARAHHAAMREVADRAVALFDAHVRQPLRRAGLDDTEAAERLVEAFRSLLPATTTLVAHHFRRILLAVAQEHIEHVGVDAELAAVHAEAARRLETA